MTTYFQKQWHLYSTQICNTIMYTMGTSSSYASKTIVYTGLNASSVFSVYCLFVYVTYLALLYTICVYFYVLYSILLSVQTVREAVVPLQYSQISLSWGSNLAHADFMQWKLQNHIDKLNKHQLDLYLPTKLYNSWVRWFAMDNWSKFSNRYPTWLKEIMNNLLTVLLLTKLLVSVFKHFIAVAR